jgi:transposase-like protein
MMAERGLSMPHTAITRRMHHYAPEFEHRWNHFAQPAGASWRVDETYVKVRGERVCLDRAVDRAGNTVPAFFKAWNQETCAQGAA